MKNKMKKIILAYIIIIGFNSCTTNDETSKNDQDVVIDTPVIEENNGIRLLQSSTTGSNGFTELITFEYNTKGLLNKEISTSNYISGTVDTYEKSFTYNSKNKEETCKIIFVRKEKGTITNSSTDYYNFTYNSKGLIQEDGRNGVFKYTSDDNKITYDYYLGSISTHDTNHNLIELDYVDTRYRYSHDSFKNPLITTHTQSYLRYKDIGNNNIKSSTQEMPYNSNSQTITNFYNYEYNNNNFPIKCKNENSKGVITSTTIYTYNK